MQETETRLCDACGEMKTDVCFRPWNTFDGSEWEFLCASCATKKERAAKRDSMFLLGLAVIAFATMVMFSAYIFIVSILT